MFKLIAKDSSGLLSYISVNIFTALTIISAILVLPQYAYKENARLDACLDKGQSPKYIYFTSLTKI